MLLSAQANLDVLPNPPCPKVFLVTCIYLKNGRTCTDNNHGTFDSKNFNLQPFARCPSLLNFARIFLPIKWTFSCSKIRGTKLHTFSKIFAGVFSLLDFKVCLHSQLLDFSIKVSCSGFMEAGSMRCLGVLPMADSTGVLPLKVPCVFLTVAVLRINWAGVI